MCCAFMCWMQVSASCLVTPHVRRCRQHLARGQHCHISSAAADPASPSTSGRSPTSAAGQPGEDSSTSSLGSSAGSAHGTINKQVVATSMTDQLYQYLLAHTREPQVGRPCQRQLCSRQAISHGCAIKASLLCSKPHFEEQHGLHSSCCCCSRILKCCESGMKAGGQAPPCRAECQGCSTAHQQPASTRPPSAPPTSNQHALTRQLPRMLITLRCCASCGRRPRGSMAPTCRSRLSRAPSWRCWWSCWGSLARWR